MAKFFDVYARTVAPAVVVLTALGLLYGTLADTMPTWSLVIVWIIWAVLSVSTLTMAVHARRLHRK
ncbi:hypothetical protein [Streptomyces tubercidicus]|uniref:hypothetical protein n=1 Tax=Streptomyces tubercidicus TaxID=47759 RepID=UPI0036748C13